MDRAMLKDLESGCKKLRVTPGQLPTKKLSPISAKNCILPITMRLEENFEFQMKTQPLDTLSLALNSWNQLEPAWTSHVQKL